MNKEQLRFVAQYLEVAQIEMKFIDPVNNYTSLISPKQLETIKYGYEKIDGRVCNLRSAIVLLYAMPYALITTKINPSTHYKVIDGMRNQGMLTPFNNMTTEEILELNWAKIL